MDIIFKHPSYLQIHEACVKLAEKIKAKRRYNKFNKFSYILALSPGGLVPATILSHHMGNIPLVPIVCPRIFGTASTKNCGLIDIKKELNYCTSTKIETPSVLVVSDVYNSGYRIGKVCDFYRDTGHEVYSCTLYYRPKLHAITFPTFYWEKVEEGTIIRFPWENKPPCNKLA